MHEHALNGHPDVLRRGDEINCVTWEESLFSKKSLGSAEVIFGSVNIGSNCFFSISLTPLLSSVDLPCS